MTTTYLNYLPDEMLLTFLRMVLCQNQLPVTILKNPPKIIVQQYTKKKQA